MRRDKRMTNEETFWFTTTCLLVALIITAFLFLFFDTSYLNQPMDFIVAIGTLALALVAIVTTQGTKKSSDEYIKKIDSLVTEIKRDRMIGHIRHQLDELYMPIISQHNNNSKFFPDGQDLYELIKRKMYLGEPLFRVTIISYRLARDEYELNKRCFDETEAFINPDCTISEWGEGRDRALSALNDKEGKMNLMGQKLIERAYQDIGTLQERMESLMKGGR